MKKFLFSVLLFAIHTQFAGPTDEVKNRCDVEQVSILAARALFAEWKRTIHGHMYYQITRKLKNSSYSLHPAIEAQMKAATMIDEVVNIQDHDILLKAIELESVAEITHNKELCTHPAENQRIGFAMAQIFGRIQQQIKFPLAVELLLKGLNPSYQFPAEIVGFLQKEKIVDDEEKFYDC